jgi:lipid A 3-O-deacylase
MHPFVSWLISDFGAFMNRSILAAATMLLFASVAVLAQRSSSSPAPDSSRDFFSIPSGFIEVPSSRPPIVFTNPLDTASQRQPSDYGVLFQGGMGLTDNRDGFKFLLAGVHVGRVLTNNFGKGVLRGNFEYAIEVFPFWQSFTPRFQRVSCTQPTGTALIACSQPYTVGGTFHGASVTPVILRWNFARHGRFTPWVQGAGGLLWTNHKYPSYGDTSANLNTNGPNGDASIWNFTPQGGVGFHYFTRPDRSIDFTASGVHISSSSLGDRNPGVNASVQFSVGYSWWTRREGFDRG